MIPIPPSHWVIERQNRIAYPWLEMSVIRSTPSW